MNQKNIEASIKNLKVQVGQLAKQLSEQPSGSFSANTQVNPNEQCKAVVTRQGTVVGLKDTDKKIEDKTDDHVVINEQKEEEVISEKEKQKSKPQVSDKGKAVIDHPPVQHLPYPHAPSKKEKER